MRSKIFLVFVLTAFGIAGAFAGRGGPSVEGYWIGSGQAIYLDGTVVEITRIEAWLEQTGAFVHGETFFTVAFGPDELTFPGLASAYIKGNVIRGTFGLCETVAPDCQGAAVFEGKIAGNKLSGTVVDLSDGSSGFVSLKRTSEPL